MRGPGRNLRAPAARPRRVHSLGARPASRTVAATLTQVSSGGPWTSCLACGWSGGPYSYLVIERWVLSPYGPSYLEIRAHCPVCQGPVPRR